MSWLVRMQLDKTALVQCSFRDSYAWHQALWECFPGTPDAKRDFLIRMDWLTWGCRVYLLCLRNPVRPSWCPPDAWAVKSIPSSFLQHESYLFDLIANPTKKTSKYTPDGKPCRNGKRIALVGESPRREWLISKAEQHGFHLDGNFIVEEAGISCFRRHSCIGTHVGVRFKGRLQVTDRERFIHAFYHGIGTAKGFGFGMLLLQPLW